MYLLENEISDRIAYANVDISDYFSDKYDIDSVIILKNTDMSLYELLCTYIIEYEIIANYIKSSEINKSLEISSLR